MRVSFVISIKYNFFSVKGSRSIFILSKLFKRIRNIKRNYKTNQKISRIEYRHFKSHFSELRIQRFPFKSALKMEDTAPILKLDVDCCEEIFEYLSVNDLQSLGQTCRAMQRVAGQYFQRSFASSRKTINKCGIYMPYNSEKSSARVKINPGFHRFISGALVCESDAQSIDFQSKISEHDYQTLTELKFTGQNLTQNLVASIEKILPKIEIVRMDGCSVDGDFYENVLKFCVNLRELYIRFDVEIVKPNSPSPWLRQKYPSLEVLQLKPGDIFEIPELSTFLEQNSTIHTFLTTTLCLYENSSALLCCNVKLDRLVLNDGYIFEPMDKQTLCELLKKLHARGFYKRLRFKFYDFKREYVRHLAMLQGVEEFLIDEIVDECDFSGFPDVKLLDLCGYFDYKSHIVSLATRLRNLEYLTIGRTDFTDILIFIQRSTKLKTITIRSFRGDLNLVKLNF